MTKRTDIPTDIDTQNPAPAPCQSDHIWVKSADMGIDYCTKCGLPKVD